MASARLLSSPSGITNATQGVFSVRDKGVCMPDNFFASSPERWTFCVIAPDSTRLSLRIENV